MSEEGACLVSNRAKKKLVNRDTAIIASTRNARNSFFTSRQLALAPGVAAHRSITAITASLSIAHATNSPTADGLKRMPLL